MKMTGWKNVVRRIKTEKLVSRKGLTLTELLASIVILGMIGMVLGGGVMMVKNVTQKTQDKSNAEQVLTVAAQLMSDEFAYSTEIDTDDSGAATDAGTNPRFRSGNSGLWLKFDASDMEGSGIRCVYGQSGTGSAIPLMTAEAVTDAFYTAFDSYEYKDGCFIVKNLAVYRKNAAQGTSPTPVVQLPELTVRAVNLEK